MSEVRPVGKSDVANDPLGAAKHCRRRVRVVDVDAQVDVVGLEAAKVFAVASLMTSRSQISEFESPPDDSRRRPPPGA